MAKKFTGFKPETMQKKILPALGYKGAMDQKSINAFLAASPAAAAKMGKYTMIARQMVEGKRVGAFMGLFGGPKFGTPEYAEQTKQTHQRALDAQKAKKTMEEGSLRDRLNMATKPGQMPGPNEVSLPEAIRGSNKGAGTPARAQGGNTFINQGSSNLSLPGPESTSPDAADVFKNTENTQGTTATSGGGMPSGSNLTGQIAQDPTKPVTVANVVSADGGDAAKIAEGTGQLGEANVATLTSAGEAAQAAMPVKEEAVTYSADKSATAVGNVLSGTQAQQGQVSSDAVVQAQQADPDKASALALNAAQLGQAQTVQSPAPMQVTQDQLVDGSAVDMQQVGQTFGTGQVKAATVQLSLIHI